MGLIADRLSELRFDPQAWIADDDPDEGRPTPSGVRVTVDAAISLPTFWACLAMISGDVSLAPVGVGVRIGGSSFPEYRDLPGWLTAPHPGNPNYLFSDYVGEIASSILTDGSYFTWVAPNVYDARVLTVMDPARMVIRDGPRYDLLDDMNRVVTTFGPDEMLHGWLPGTWPPGRSRPYGAVETLRRAIGSAIAAEEFAARFFGQGSQLSFGVEVPGALADQQRAELREALRRRHQGLSNSHMVGILTRGAKFVPGLQTTPEQSQMLATRKFGVEEMARIFHVPPGMVGSQEPGASSYASAIEWRKEDRDKAVIPLTTNIERQHARLLSVPSSVTDPRATVALSFDLDWIARTDMAARYAAHEVAIRGGFRTPNEARRVEGDQPMAGGDTLYMLQQMVPIADLGMTKATEPLQTQAPSAAEAQRSDMAEMLAISEASAIRMAAAFGREPVTVQNILPPSSAPVVNVPAQAAPVVNVSVPAQAAPVVHVPAQPAPVVHVNVPPQRGTTRTIVREGGLITKMVEEPNDGE